MKNIAYLFFVIALLAVSACKKEHSKPKPPPVKVTKHDTAVYVVGFIAPDNGFNINACYWKNDTLVNLTPTSAFADAVSIAVQDTNIYIAGYSQNVDNSTFTALYWKNGKMSQLPGGSVASSRATAITTSGNDVYISGYIGPHNTTNASQAVYWKNGTLITLTDASATMSAFAMGIAVQGNDVYVIGYTLDANLVSTAVYWKNGVMTKFDNSSAAITGIAVSGSDVYMAYDATVSGQTTAYSWKDGVSTALPNSGVSPAFTAGITVNGGDVYIAGSITYSNAGVACYWKNGVQTLLQIPGNLDYGYNSANTETFYFLNNIYSIGTNYTGSDTQAYYWLNTTSNELNTNYSSGEAGIGVAY